MGGCGGWGARVERVGVGVRWDGAEGDLFLNEASDRLKALHVFELVGYLIGVTRVFGSFAFGTKKAKKMYISTLHIMFSELRPKDTLR